MPKQKHANARTSRAVREAIRASPDSLRVLAARYGINLKTAAKWKRRTQADDLPSGPKKSSRGSLTAEEEEIVVGFRRKTLLPLDDCLYSLQARIPDLSRSTLHRCLVRHGLNRLPESARPRPGRQRAGSAPLGILDIDVTTTMTADGPIEVFVAMDRVSRFVFLDTAASADEDAAHEFLRKVIAEALFVVSVVNVAWAPPFVGIAGRSRFSALCAELGIEMREAGQVELGRLSGFDELDWAGSEAVLPEGRPAFEARLRDFVHAYNYRRRLKTLRGSTPFEFVCSRTASVCTTR